LGGGGGGGGDGCGSVSLGGGGGGRGGSCIIVMAIAIAVLIWFTTLLEIICAGKDNNNMSLQAWLQSPQLNGPNGLHVDNNKNRLIVTSLVDMSKPRAGIEVVDLKNKTISSLGKEGTTSPFGGLDGIESDATETHYYVTDNPAGKIYTVNADGTGYAALIDLHTQGTADLGFIPSQSVIIIPLMQDNKLVAYKLVE
jgi:hypothetical protein